MDGTDLAVLQVPCGGISAFVYNATTRDLITMYAGAYCTGKSGLGDPNTSACPKTPPYGGQTFLLLYNGLNDITQSFKYGPPGVCPYGNG